MLFVPYSRPTAQQLFRSFSKAYLALLVQKNVLQSRRQLHVHSNPDGYSSLTLKGMVTCGSGKDVDQESLVSQLPRLANGSGSLRRRCNIAVFLVTPALAHLLDERCDFIQRCMTRIFSGYKLQSPGAIRAICAVIDKFPGPGVTPNARVLNPREGFAFCLAREAMGARARPSIPAVQIDLAEEQDDQFPAHILIQQSAVRLPQQHPVGAVSAPNHGNIQYFGYHAVALPTANTLFVNGKRSTLQVMEWRVPEDPCTEFHEGFVPQFRSPLRNVRLSKVGSFGPNNMSLLPLRPLTEPRRIVDAFGNILRSIEVDGSMQPASTELEVSIMEANKSAKLNVQGDLRPLVYALISRTKSPTIPSSENRSLWKDVCYGEKQLYRVTGGGGGWGSKTGLLSLEIEVGINPFPPKKSGQDTGDGDEYPQFEVTANDLMGDGKTVQFWAYDHRLVEGEASATAATELPDWNMEQQVPTEEAWMLVGTTPAQEDSNSDMLESASEPAGAPTDVSQDDFGILSEGGMAMLFYYDPIQAFQMRRLDPAEIMLQTNISIPNAWVATGQSPEFRRPHGRTRDKADPIAQRDHESIKAATIKIGKVPGDGATSVKFTKGSVDKPMSIKNRNVPVKKATPLKIKRVVLSNSIASSRRDRSIKSAKVRVYSKARSRRATSIKIRKLPVDKATPIRIRKLPFDKATPIRIRKLPFDSKVGTRQHKHVKTKERSGAKFTARVTKGQATLPVHRRVRSRKPEDVINAVQVPGSDHVVDLGSKASL